MRLKCKFEKNNDNTENNEFKDGYLLGFSVDSKGDKFGMVYPYPVALIETKEFGQHVLKEIPIESGNIIFEDMADL